MFGSLDQLVIDLFLFYPLSPGMILHMHVQNLVARPLPSAEDWDRIIKEDEERFAKVQKRRGESKGRPKKERPEIQIRSATHVPQDRNLNSDTADAGGDAGDPVHGGFEGKSTEEPAAPGAEIRNDSDLEDSDDDSSSTGSESTDDSDSSEGDRSE